MTYIINQDNPKLANITINTKLYNIETIFAASYVFLDKAYLIIDQKDSDIIITLEAKQNENTENLAKEFHNELINYENYILQAKKTKELRETILKRALITNSEEALDKND